MTGSIEKSFLEIITNTLSDSSFLGDDCAYLKEYELCITQDTLYEDVHFKMSAMTPQELAKKAVLVNISDVLASGAKPNYITISLCGNLTKEFVKEFYIGVENVCKKYDVKVIGGDLCAGEKIVVSVCALGSTQNRNISSRKNAEEGYVVAVCGEFGSSAKGLLDILLKKKSEYTKVHIEPKLYPKMSENIALGTKKPYAMMDSSDGLYDALSQISLNSGVKIDVEYDKIPKTVLEKELVLFGGEDYSLVVMLDEKDFATIDMLGEGLIKIGKVSKGSGVWVDGEEITDDKGYKHWE